MRAYRRYHKLAADGLGQVNINLCHHSRIHNVIYFRCVHHLFLFRYILHILLFTNIHNLSISLPHSLSLSDIYLSPSLSSDTFTVTRQTCQLSPSLSLAHSLALTSHPHPLYCLLFWTQPLCLSLSLSIFLQPR